MKKEGKPAPTFKNEDAERAFWATHSPLDYGYVESFVAGGGGPFPNLKPTLKSISIRIPADMLAELKALANKIDVPYQSLAKVFLAKQIAAARGEETHPRGPHQPQDACRDLRKPPPVRGIPSFSSASPLTPATDLAK